MNMKLGIGIDTGGTYTDAVIYDFDKKEVVAKGKTLTTKENLETGIGNALDALPAGLLKQADILSLSTTLATNACVENKGGRAKLILLGTTQKVLEWIDAKSVYGLKNEDVLCIDTKSSFDGKVIDNPDWKLVSDTENAWFSGAQALAVAEVSAIRNGGTCEKTAKDKLTPKYDVPFVMASELSTGLNVMERGATALLNAKLLPIIQDFMAAVIAALQKRTLNVKQMIVRSDGSLMSGEWALRHPVKTILSGPAASIIGGRGLAGCENSLIVDMGGTTTDISLVKNGEPAMTDGIRIGGFRTQIKGVFIDTFGLGGDSRITVQDNKIVLHTRRVQPLCVAAVQHPQITQSLQALVEGDKTSTLPLHEFLYLVKQPESLSGYTTHEISLLEKLSNGPLMLGSGELDLYNLKCDRLEDEGVIMRCGLTPTDIMHIKGDFSLHDSAASILGAKCLLKALPEYAQYPDGLQQLCDAVYNLVCGKLYENIVRVLLADKYPKLFEKGADRQISDLIHQSWTEQSERGFFGFQFHTQATLVGIGAPTHIFLPSVAKMLGTEYVIPAHAEVANAVGAIIADVSAKCRIDISPDYTAEGVSSYSVYTAAECRRFADVGTAVDYARTAAETTAISDAQKRGALGELHVEIQVTPKTAYAKEGSSVDLGTTVIATATGRING